MKPKKPNRVFDNMKSAAFSLGVSLDAIKYAKNHGCEAFRGTRVHERELLDWISANPIPAKPASASNSLKEEKTQEEIRKLRIANDEKEKITIKGGKAVAIIAELGAAVCGAHEKMLAQAPIAMTDDPIQNRIVLGRYVDEVRKECRQAEEKCRTIAKQS